MRQRTGVASRCCGARVGASTTLLPPAICSRDASSAALEGTAFAGWLVWFRRSGVGIAEGVGDATPEGVGDGVAVKACATVESCPGPQRTPAGRWSRRTARG